jgi:hypothetical protein
MHFSIAMEFPACRLVRSCHVSREMHLGKRGIRVMPQGNIGQFQGRAGRASVPRQAGRRWRILQATRQETRQTAGKRLDKRQEMSKWTL